MLPLHPHHPDMQPPYSPSEVSLHSSKKDCWLIIHGKVYDVTTFLDDHPGGDDVLLQASARGDATNAFEEVGHSSTATSMMEGYLIGVLDGVGDRSTAVRRKESVEPVGAASPGPATESYSLWDYLLPLLFLVLAFAAWYYLTFLNTEP